MVKYYTVKDYANITGMKESAVRELANANQLKYKKTGVKIYIAVEEDGITDELIKKVATLEEKITLMCNHFGVKLDEVTQ